MLSHRESSRLKAELRGTMAKASARIPKAKTATSLPTKQLATPPVTAPTNPPSADEGRSISAARACVSARTPRVKVKLASKTRPLEFGPVHDDRAGFLERLQNAFGTRGLAFASAELNHLVEASAFGEDGTDETRLNSLLAVVDGVQPANEIEAMLAAQVAVTHRLAMELVNRTRRAKEIPQFECAGRMATKMLQAFTTQVDLLHRLKRGPAQVVRVEHVNVFPGGQAVVGHFSTSTHNAIGGGGDGKNGHQPHAKGELPAPAAAPMPALPSADTFREPLPVAIREGESEMPDARRREG